jgi:hypothetical protein
VAGSDGRELPSGAFLTEAALGEETFFAEAAGKKQNSEDEEEAKDGDADDSAAEQDAVAGATGKHDSEEHKQERDNKALVIHTSTAGDNDEQEEAKQHAKQAKKSVAVHPQQPPRQHLFAHSALFGTSRAKIAAARSARLQAIESQFDAAMAARTLEARHAALQASLAAEEMERERETSRALRAQQKRHARLHAAKLRLDAEQRAKESSSVAREMEEVAALARRQQREFERAKLALRRKREHELRTQALLATHRDIAARWAAEEEAALKRFEEDKAERLAAAHKLKRSEGGVAVAARDAAWKKQVEKLGLKDPVVIMQALGPQPAPPTSTQQLQQQQQSHVPHPPSSAKSSTARHPAAASVGGQSHASARLPPMSSSAVTAAAVGSGATAAASFPTAATSFSSSGRPLTGGVGGGSGGGLRARRHSPPPRTYGKQLPRHWNVVNSFFEDRAAREQQQLQYVDRSPERQTKRKHRGSSASDDDADASASEREDDATAAASAAALAAEAALVAAPLPLPELAFWCSATDCAASLELLDPPARLLAASRASDPTERAARRREQDEALERVEAEFDALFAVAATSSEQWQSEHPSTGRCTLADLLARPPIPAAQ